jgi:hypothetical protein
MTMRINQVQYGMPCAAKALQEEHPSMPEELMRKARISRRFAQEGSFGLTRSLV